MTVRYTAASQRAVALVMGLLLVVGVLALLTPGRARADSAPTTPGPLTPATVTADALPTVQHNGVAWSQVVLGDIVYVAGRFSTARPAGAAPGTQEVARNNLLAYNINTGQLVTSFAPSLNAQALIITASPDGSRLYVGGDFTTVNGVGRNRVAAIAPVTGALISGFAPSVSSQVRAIAATNSTVYLGGNFASVSGNARNRLAAVNASNGAILPWAPQPGDGPTDQNSAPAPTNNSTLTHDVMAMVATNGGSQIVVAGRFNTLNGADATGVGALDAATGATRPFTLGTLITNQGINSAINSLSTDGTNVYGTGYDFYGPGNFEGSFAVTADGGNIVSMNDCHGDHYSAFATASVVYTAGHPHDCGNIGGFPEFNPRINKFATAVTIAPQGVVGPNTFGPAIRGLPAAHLLPWFPTMSPGTYTNQGQAGWSVAGNDKYVVFGGEFPRVNGVAQQGLVRYAIPSLAPNKVTPDYNDALRANVVSLSAGTARVSWQTTFDNDNENLTYKVVRADRPSTPVYETTVASTFWNRPTVGFVDRGLTVGAQYTYRVYAYDPFGNFAMRGPATVTVSNNAASGGLYSDTVLADNPAHFWRLDESAGATTSYDQAGFDDLGVNGGVTLGTPGALAGTSNTAGTFNGSGGLAATAAAVPGPQVFSVEAWFKTTSTSGGKIVGFGNQNTGTSNNYDRHIFMGGDGRVQFGVYPGFTATVGNGTRYNDGQWHHVVGTLGSTGMAMYIDGQLAGQRGDVTTAQDYSGYWRIGGDNAWAGDVWFDGAVDDVAVYGTALTQRQAQRHFVVGSTGEAFNEPPTAAFTSSANGLTASFDGRGSSDVDGSISALAWNFGDGTTGSGPTTTHAYAAPGTYRVTLTVTDNRGATSTYSRAISVVSSGTTGGAYSSAVLADGAAHYWRLGEPSGTGYDLAGADDLVVRSGVTRGSDGAIQGDVDKAATFNGSQSGSASTENLTPGPNVFTLEAWFKTTSTSGGKIVGFGNQQAGNNSSNYDRHVFMDESGRLVFGVWTGQASVVTSNPGYNNGQWHHVVASLSPAGEALYIDGALVQARNDITAGQPYDGYWRIGGDSSWAGAPYFAGVIDDVAVYPAALSAAQVQQHFTLGSNVPPPNPAPQAAFTSTVSGLTVEVDGTSSTDDGSIAAYSWAFQGGGVASGPTASYTFPGTGTYDVTLTVTDDKGATNAVTQQVSVTAPPPNQAPEAAFTSSATGLDLSVNGSSSTDSDGQVTQYAWDFGDSGTAVGATATHKYASAGTYQVTLTVTDDDGATDSVTNQVTVTAPPAGPPLVAADAFQRTVTGGFGTADLGGAWTSLYAASRQSVNNGTAAFSLAAGTQSGTYLNSVSQTAVDLTSTVTVAQAPTGGGVNVLLTGRRVGLNQEYRLRLRFLANGQVLAGWTRLSGTSSDVLIGTEVALPGTYVPGTPLRVRMNVTGTGTTQLQARVWKASDPEPATWTVARSDTTASLQAAGGVGAMAYLSGTATTAPVSVQLSGLEVRKLD
ncbi:PKD domain-containing protein [Blastococcus sp. SYSU D00922]